MKTDMYLPTTGQHYLASYSQVAVLERSGWVVYADWLASQNQTPAPAPAPAPAPEPAPAETTSTDTGTTPAPSL